MVLPAEVGSCVDQAFVFVVRSCASRPLWIDILVSIGGALLSAILGVAYHNLGRPRLHIQAAATSPRTYPAFGRVRFLQVKVTNRPWRAPFTARQTAYATTGHIRFLDSQGRQVCKRMPIRWDGAPEPVIQGHTPTGPVMALDPRLLRVGQEMNIGPGVVETIAPAVKMESEASAYGWTTMSYWYGWRHVDFVLPPGFLTAEITIQTGDYVFRKNVRFTNPSTDFERFAHEAEVA